ncbi:MAG: SulP family inorganic anion transporter, partial [Lachnospiraceae bacterium]|nr:SulP family inorganic anion transporter [Lachnospiraceae bacterium]
YFLKAGRIVKYVSVPVMGGFISGVGMTIILMQVPKLFGGKPGTGEVMELCRHIWAEKGSFHLLSFVLSMATIVIILLCKKFFPKVPMTVVMLIFGGILQAIFHLDAQGVKLLGEVSPGLPKIIIPGFVWPKGALPDLLMQTLGIAGVVMAQTLLASGSYARKYQDPLDNNKELLAYGAMNLGSAIVGGCPINGSVSRSGIADSLGVRSQIMSVSASFTMVLVLLFGTPLMKYLPVPMLTGIVVTALIGILEIGTAKKLWKRGKNELLVFLMAFFGVLFLGTIYGVVIGVLLSFGEVAVRAVVPPTAFVGRIPGHGNFYSLKRNSAARPVKNTLIYRFSGNLFFANVDLFCQEIEGAIKEDTHQVVVDARGIGSIDLTATERLVSLYRSLRERGILFYLTEHDGSLNDQLRMLGGETLIEEGAVRRTITLALRDAGLEKPYELEERTEGKRKSGGDAVAATRGSAKADAGDAEVATPVRKDVESLDRLSEFEWVFGAEAEAKMEDLAEDMAEQLVAAGEGEAEFEARLLDKEGVRTSWGMLGRFDENEFWDFMEVRLEEMVREGRITPELAARVERHVEKRREFGQKKLEELNPQAAKLLARHGEVIRNYVKRNHPKEYERYVEVHGKSKDS